MRKRVHILGLLLFLCLSEASMTRKHRHNSEFESLLAEYSHFKETNLHSKAKRLLSKSRHSLKITSSGKKKRKKSRRLVDQEHNQSNI